MPTVNLDPIGLLTREELDAVAGRCGYSVPNLIDLTPRRFSDRDRLREALPITPLRYARSGDFVRVEASLNRRIALPHHMWGRGGGLTPSTIQATRTSASSWLITTTRQNRSLDQLVLRVGQRQSLRGSFYSISGTVDSAWGRHLLTQAIEFIERPIESGLAYTATSGRCWVCNRTIDTDANPCGVGSRCLDRIRDEWGVRPVAGGASFCGSGCCWDGID